MISKMKDAPAKGGEGSKIAIIFNGSPLFSGDAGSGPSNIRRWNIENDWLDAIVALPDQIFYNTGIFTYVWLVTNRKPAERRGKVQLIDGTRFFQKMKKSLNNKRNELSDAHIARLTEIYGNFQNVSARWFRSTLARWTTAYNQKRAHSAIGYLTPVEFAGTLTATGALAPISTRDSSPTWMNDGGHSRTSAKSPPFRPHNMGQAPRVQSSYLRSSTVRSFNGSSLVNPSLDMSRSIRKEFILCARGGTDQQFAEATRKSSTIFQSC